MTEITLKIMSNFSVFACGCPQAARPSEQKTCMSGTTYIRYFKQVRHDESRVN